MAWIVNLILGPHRYETQSAWGVVTAICAVFASVILSLVATISILFGLSAISPEFASGARECLSTVGTLPSAECAIWLLVSMGAAAIFMCVAFYLLSHARRGSTPENALLLRAAGLRWWQYVALIVIMLGIVYVCEKAVSLLTGATQADLEQGIEYIKALTSHGGWRIWLLLIAVVVVFGPLWEELVFRGFMFTVLVDTRAGFIGAAAITSGIWTLMHYAYSWQILIVLFIIGICLSFAVWRTGSLWPGVVAHGAINMISTIALAWR